MKVKRLLLVDDDDISNFITLNAIDKIQFADEVIVKRNGKEALNYLNAECCSLNKYPNLILLDLKMPGTDGFDFLAEFGKISRSLKADIVVVVLTSSKSGDDILRLRQMGNYFLYTKPLVPEQLLDIHRKFFNGMDVVN